MNRPLAYPMGSDLAGEAAEPPLSQQELKDLRRILSVIRVDPVGDTLRIETGAARILLRPDGTVRIEGRSLTQMARGSIVLNAAAIELN